VIDTLEEIQERHDAVKEIEKKLLELHQVAVASKLLNSLRMSMFYLPSFFLLLGFHGYGSIG